MKRILILIVILILGPKLMPGIAIAQEDVKHNRHPDKAAPTLNLKVLGRPTFSESKNGMKAKLWLLTREEHDRLLSMPKDGRSTKWEGDKNIDQSEKNNQSVDPGETTVSNPKIAIVVLDDLEGKIPILDAILEITAKSPQGIPLTRGLIAARDHYATELEFSEKGIYKLALRITRNGRTTMMYFETPVSISMN